MKLRRLIVMAATALAGLSVAIGAWGYFYAAGPGPVVPGGYEIWAALRPGQGWERFWNFREGLRYYGGALFLLTAALALLHYAVVGPDRVPLAGRVVQRYWWSEVLMHTVLAVSFLVLWVSGLYLLWSHLFREGPAFWGGLASGAHIWGGLVFLVALLAMWIQWRRDMRFVPYDREWLKRAGGYLNPNHPHLPAGRFNAGQKVWFRVALILGAVLGVTGLLLYYPGGFGLTPFIQRALYIVHAAGAAAMTCVVVLHVYLATVAIPGVFKSMVTGCIDENLIHVHHPGVAAIRGGGSEASRS